MQVRPDLLQVPCVQLAADCLHVCAVVSARVVARRVVGDQVHTRVCVFVISRFHMSMCRLVASTCGI